MSCRTILIVGVLLIAGRATASQYVVLTSGERLLVEAVDYTDAGVVIDHPLLGRVTLPIDAVARVEAAGRSDAQPGESPAVAPAPSREPGGSAPPALQPTADTPEVEPKPGRGGLFGTGLLAGWNTNLSLGFSGASGNVDRQNLATQFTTSRRTDQQRTLFEASGFYGVSRGDTTQNQARGRITQDWMLPDSKWFVFAKGEHEYDQLREWEHRSSGYTGLGYNFIQKDDFEIVVRAGAGANYEFGSVNELSPEALFGGSVFKWAINRNHNLSAIATIYPDLEYGGESRINAGVDWIINLPDTPGLKLNIGMVSDYESTTTGDDKHHDLRYYTSLILAF